MTSYAFIGHYILFHGDMSHFSFYVTMTSWLHYMQIIATTWRNRYNDSYCMNHAVWVIILLKRLFFELIQVENQFNQLVRQFNRGRKPSGWKAHVRFSGKTYRVRLYSTTRWRKISIIKIFPLFSPGLDQHFSNRLFQLFSHMKPDKLGIVGKRRFSSFIWRGLEKNFHAKKFFRPYGSTSLDLLNSTVFNVYSKTERTE